MRLDRDGRPDGTPVVTGRALDPLFAAVVEASEEAVLNSMFTAPTVTGRDGNTSETIHTAGDHGPARMRVEEVRIPVRDGSHLAATLVPPGPVRRGRSRA